MASEQDINEVVKFYSNLLTAQYDKPKAKAHLENFLKTASITGVLQDLQTAFDIDTAIGKQLDIVASTKGIDRTYSGGLLTDTEFRLILYFQIAKNKSNNSLYEINELMFNFFNGNVKVFSDKMEIHYIIPLDISNILVKAIEKKALPRPIGNVLNVIKTDEDFFCFANYGATQEDLDKMIGFDSYGENGAGYFLSNINFVR